MSTIRKLPMTDEQREQIERFRDVLNTALKTNDLTQDGLIRLTVERRLAVGELATWTLTVKYYDTNEHGHKYVVT